MKNKIVFVDCNSRLDQHLSGNISFIYQFINAQKTNCLCSYYFLGQEDYSENLINFIETHYNIKLLKFKGSLITGLREKDVCIYLYPKYIDFLKNIILRIRKIQTIGVNHGHFNSFASVEHSVLIKLKNLIKYIYFTPFDCIVVYSEHILINLINECPRLLKIVRIIAIHEIIQIPFYVDKDAKNNRQFLSIGYKTELSSLQFKCIKVLEKIGFKILLVRIDKLSSSSQYYYFEAIYNLDILFLPKDHHYCNQVSGVVNDCFALNTLPLGKSSNKHLSHSLKLYMDESSLTIDNPLFANNIQKYLDSSSYLWSICHERMKNISCKNYQKLANLLNNRPR